MAQNALTPTPTLIGSVRQRNCEIWLHQGRTESWPRKLKSYVTQEAVTQWGLLCTHFVTTKRCTVMQAMFIFVFIICLIIWGNSLTHTASQPRRKTPLNSTYLACLGSAVTSGHIAPRTAFDCLVVKKGSPMRRLPSMAATGAKITQSFDSCTNSSWEHSSKGHCNLTYQSSHGNLMMQT